MTKAVFAGGDALEFIWDVPGAATACCQQFGVRGSDGPAEGRKLVWWSGVDGLRIRFAMGSPVAFG